MVQGDFGTVTGAKSIEQNLEPGSPYPDFRQDDRSRERGRIGHVHFEVQCAAFLVYRVTLDNFHGVVFLEASYDIERMYVMACDRTR